MAYTGGAGDEPVEIRLVAAQQFHFLPGCFSGPDAEAIACKEQLKNRRPAVLR
jgi:hypothetical protein